MTTAIAQRIGVTNFVLSLATSAKAHVAGLTKCGTSHIVGKAIETNQLKRLVKMG
jgi:hypothetical protein